MHKFLLGNTRHTACIWTCTVHWLKETYKSLIYFKFISIESLLEAMRSKWRGFAIAYVHTYGMFVYILVHGMLCIIRQTWNDSFSRKKTIFDAEYNLAKRKLKSLKYMTRHCLQWTIAKRRRSQHLCNAKIWLHKKRNQLQLPTCNNLHIMTNEFIRFKREIIHNLCIDCK